MSYRPRPWRQTTTDSRNSAGRPHARFIGVRLRDGCGRSPTIPTSEAQRRCDVGGRLTGGKETGLSQGRHYRSNRQ
eukprot:7513183-Pyramimonas_sp.AAC.1